MTQGVPKVFAKTWVMRQNNNYLDMTKLWILQSYMISLLGVPSYNDESILG